LGDALLRGEDIVFKRTENDFYFTWKKDQVMSACDIWMYITGKVPLEFKQFNEVDNVISRWRTDLYNDVSALRGENGGIAQISTEVVAAAIGGSIGLWPFEGPYLRMTPVSSEMIQQYIFSAGEVVRVLGLKDDETNSIKKIFGVNFRGAYKLNVKAHLYQAKNMPF